MPVEPEGIGDVQFDQLLRRLSWRVRRWFHRPADNDPIVSVELRPPQPAAKADPRAVPARINGKRRWKLARTALAFLATLSILGLAYGGLVAVNSRVKLDLSVTPTVTTGESHVVAAAAALLALGTDSAGIADDDLLFVPSGRQMRERRFRDGAVEAAARFVMLAGPPQGRAGTRADLALADARLAIVDGVEAGDVERIAARDALLRLNARIVRQQTRLDTGAPALAALIRAAADACEKEARALSTLAAEPTWLAAPTVEAGFYHARGVAYGWLMLVRAALQDAPERARAAALEASIPIDALRQISERQPLFLFNGDPAAPWAPAHVAITAADFTRAAIGARALASALEQQP